MLNLEALLAPVSAQQPCGEDLAFSSEVDAIARARQADDPSIEQGAWVTDLKEADWKFVARSCAQLIEKRSKDLQLAVWLAEASVRTGGLRAFGDSLALIALLCERYWDGLYPLPDEDGVERRIGNLAWVASRIAPWLREVALTEGPKGYALRDFDVARMHGGEQLAKLEAARAAGSAAFWEGMLRDAEFCAGAIEQLEKSVDARLGADGPSFSAARSGLESVLLFIKPEIKQASGAGSGAAPVAKPAMDGVLAGGQVAVVPGSAAGAIAMHGQALDRVQALAQLRAVAAFFRRTEPHSPVAYLADKAAAWGEQPLHVWLRAVIKDDASYAHIEEMLGVAPKS
ncbi:type VI secretion system protein TssA [Massilia sp. 9096]|uniref:type VI secretion system protein TssA n=1 Tax=Massilia sp. 9096 TaxID=1500894 RepID=UPI00055DBB47|nr:type VI secretion system protein TssA [Massilia sp. 9096]